MTDMLDMRFSRWYEESGLLGFRRWRRYFPPKCWALSELQGDTTPQDRTLDAENISAHYSTLDSLNKEYEPIQLIQEPAISHHPEPFKPN
jgi:hypothetical protein